MGNKITKDYAQELAEYICTQLYGNLNPAYLKCESFCALDGVKCNCKEVYNEILNTEDNTLEYYLTNKIFDFIEGERIK